MQDLDKSDLGRGFFAVSNRSPSKNRAPTTGFRNGWCKYCRSRLGRYNKFNVCFLCIAKVRADICRTAGVGEDDDGVEALVLKMLRVKDRTRVSNKKSKR